MKLGDSIAEGIHYVTGIQPCGGCNKRREQLNDFGDRLVNKIDLLRHRGKIETMTYLITVNTQKQYKVEATTDDEALTKVGPDNLIFSATTNNVRIQAPNTPGTPSPVAVPA